MQGALVLIGGIEEGLATARGPKGAVSRGEKHPPNTAPRRSRVDEEQIHLAVGGMDGREANDPISIVSRNQHQVRWRVVGNVLVPLGCCEHGPAGKLPQIGPPHTNRRVEDHADRLSIAWFGSPQADARNLRVSHLEAPAGSATGLYRGQTDGGRG